MHPFVKLHLQHARDQEKAKGQEENMIRVIAMIIKMEENETNQSNNLGRTMKKETKRKKKLENQTEKT